MQLLNVSKDYLTLKKALLNAYSAVSEVHRSHDDLEHLREVMKLEQFYKRIPSDLHFAFMASRQSPQNLDRSCKTCR